MSLHDRLFLEPEDLFPARLLTIGADAEFGATDSDLANVSIYASHPVDGQTRQLTSGRDADAEEAWNQLQAAGLSPSRRPAVTDHVEMKLAARMVNQGTKHTDVVLNNRPCTGRTTARPSGEEASGRARNLVRPRTRERPRPG
ncbi:DddA-like double-stranded DNA deaminase toxin [Amycolatopsis sp. CA-230715]|uniref:DddA-like double-stranded DNA deaminase toxin n=1 Tax=Amycolatopsis sp. CA-230715 TaxID=2745196 RepID=UPI001C01282D